MLRVSFVFKPAKRAIANSPALSAPGKGTRRQSAVGTAGCFRKRVKPKFVSREAAAFQIAQHVSAGFAERGRSREAMAHKSRLTQSESYANIEPCLALTANSPKLIA